MAERRTKNGADAGIRGTPWKWKGTGVIREPKESNASPSGGELAGKLAGEL